MNGDWREQAKCLGENPEMWFPKGPSYAGGRALTDQAKAICWTCPVRRDCTDWAIETGENWGVWGGLDADERRTIRRREQRERRSGAA